MKKITSAILILTVLLSMASLGGCHIAKKAKYVEAQDLLSAGNYEAAYELFLELGNYEDSEAYLSRFHHVITYRTCEYEFGDEDVLATLEIVFDKNNLPTEHIFTTGDSVTGDTFEYDERGNLIREESTLMEGMTFVYVYTYDDNNRLVREVYSDYDGYELITEYVYDENGRLVEEIMSSENSKPTKKIYTHDEKGNCIKSVYTDRFGFETVYEYSFNEQGKMTEYIYSSIFDSGRQQYFYDENGNLVKETYTYSDGDTTTTEYTLDEQGRVVRIYSVDTYGTVSAVEFTYDEHGNIVKEVSALDENVTVYTYTYKLVYIPFDVSEKVMDLLVFQYNQ